MMTFPLAAPAFREMIASKLFRDFTQKAVSPTMLLGEFERDVRDQS